MFRRHKSEDGDVPTSSTEQTSEAGKGRPTPTRKEAEAARKARVKPTVTGRAARKQERERMRGERARQMQAMREGDERYFNARDRGPARAFVRDYVDSRRLVAEFFLLGLLLILLASFTGIPRVVATANLMWLVLLVYVTFEMIWLNRQVKRLVAARFPDAPLKGTGLYAIARATQIRRFRLPKPRVRPGATV